MKDSFCNIVTSFCDHAGKAIAATVNVHLVYLESG